MNVLFVSAEVAPMVKIGGLADVVGALPRALHALGHDVRILLPKYAVIDPVKFPSQQVLHSLPVPWQGQDVPVNLYQGRLPNSDIIVYYLDCPKIFGDLDVLHGLKSVYANSNDHALLQSELQRFTFFAWAATNIVLELPFQPDVVHCHDWHAAGMALFMRLRSMAIPSVLTIHNLQNQGKWSAEELLGWVGLTEKDHASLTKRDQWKNFNLLQQGIINADAVNTVSPTYAQEILTEEYGEGLQNDLQQRPDGVQGILNGIDVTMFDPSHDENIVTQFDPNTVDHGKASNKAALQQQLGLPVDPTLPMFAAVTRLTAQKGLDLLLEHLPSLMQQPLQIVILGSGHPDVERSLREIASQYPHKLHVIFDFDVVLAQHIYAGADYFLMPSRFEPCGLGQLIAMRYGTLPIVRATGGLKDTVIDLRQHPDQGTGFVFQEFRVEKLEQAMLAAVHFFSQPAFSSARRRAMAKDFSWTASARQYEILYHEVWKRK